MATYWENSCSFGLRYVSWYKYLIVSLVFSHLGFWSGNLFLIVPFPDLCLLVPSYVAPLDITIIIKYCVRFAISCVNRITKVTFLPNTNYNTCTGFPIFVRYSDLKVKLYMYTFFTSLIISMINSV